MKTILKMSAAGLALLIGTLTSVPVRASGELLVPVGETVGISVQCRDVTVSGFAEVETETGVVCPAREAGIRPGDVITALNGERLTGGAMFLQRAAACGRRAAGAHRAQHAAGDLRGVLQTL